MEIGEEVSILRYAEDGAVEEEPWKCVECGTTRKRLGSCIRFCSAKCRDKWLSGARFRAMRYNEKQKEEEF